MLHRHLATIHLLHALDQITVDQAIYAKAVEVCNNPRIKDSLDRIVLRMGGFHLSMTFIAVIGRRYARCTD